MKCPRCDGAGELPPKPPVLTSQQLTVLEQLALGMSHPEVARRMHLAVSTVRTYSFRARRYFGVASTKEAVAKARLWDVI